METSPDGAAPEPDGAPAVVPLPSPDLLRDALAEENEEVRRLVDAGASSPEDIRALAALMREQREREASVWARDVKPGLIKARKASLHLGDLRRQGEDRDSSQSPFLLVVGVVALVVLALLFAMELSLVVVLIPVMAFFGYAWWLGTHPPAGVDAVDPSDGEAPTA